VGFGSSALGVRGLEQVYVVSEDEAKASVVFGRGSGVGAGTVILSKKAVMGRTEPVEAQPVTTPKVRFNGQCCRSRITLSKSSMRR
jgi:glucokinase